MDLLEHFQDAKRDPLRRLLAEKSAWFSQDKKGFLRYRLPLRSVQDLRASSCDFSGDVVRIGTADDLSADDHARVHQILRGLMPWRKGPFSVFGIDIDAEWRSERKWNRLVPELPALAGKMVADIGCNNGYYMFRMAPYQPTMVLGFEPYVHHYYTFNILNTFAQQPNLRAEPLGIEHLALFPECFDVIFCLGILYHRPSPLEALRDLHSALRPGGILLVESQAIAGNDPVALFPAHTYAKVPGTWFVPTATCLHNWLTRTGFTEVRLFCDHAMSSAEQRRTAWMEFESYQDFIDKDNPALTIEGYPAPRRVFFKAKK
ncbi:methyltransferase [Desulfobulbus propionicus DSM 2032]|uniref:Methyltransferase n=1 Tax=Desulfobulbus propionicus (strain ATCC 33891 / DSM 2032 / VKM B-1956 / 1pr3) TaxID=577650 RepID=A0A7U3YNR5_DESPD|nr:tRNA 5-methoxyuridine(34)/uridine 5-oxyacetic acid(34) synthase CmoB [Desulfobulbus propionicus]ADW18764.1 methyltransferase [Desulfobulbus propionicus DSM 2032]